MVESFLKKITLAIVSIAAICEPVRAQSFDNALTHTERLSVWQSKIILLSDESLDLLFDCSGAYFLSASINYDSAASSSGAEDYAIGYLEGSLGTDYMYLAGAFGQAAEMSTNIEGAFFLPNGDTPFSKQFSRKTKITREKLLVLNNKIRECNVVHDEVAFKAGRIFEKLANK